MENIFPSFCTLALFWGCLSTLNLACTEPRDQPTLRAQSLLWYFLSVHLVLGMCTAFEIPPQTQVLLNVLISQRNSPQLLPLGLRGVYCFHINLFCFRCHWVIGWACSSFERCLLLFWLESDKYLDKYLHTLYKPFR